MSWQRDRYYGERKGVGMNLLASSVGSVGFGHGTTATRHGAVQGNNEQLVQ